MEERCLAKSVGAARKRRKGWGPSRVCDTWPYRVLQMRGTARIEMVQGVAPEYEAAAKRYFGEEEGRAWVKQVKATISHMARIAITPEWVAILDFETRFPSAISG
jgi:hypothetical protein